jgi:hypothetical protein
MYNLDVHAPWLNTSESVTGRKLAWRPTPMKVSTISRFLSGGRRLPVAPDTAAMAPRAASSVTPYPAPPLRFNCISLEISISRKRLTADPGPAVFVGLFLWRIGPQGLGKAYCCGSHHNRRPLAQTGQERPPGKHLVLFVVLLLIVHSSPLSYDVSNYPRLWFPGFSVATPRQETNSPVPSPCCLQSSNVETEALFLWLPFR